MTGMFRRFVPRNWLSRVGFSGLGRFIVRHPLVVIASWLAVAGVLLAAVPSLPAVAERNPPGFLPADSEVFAAGNAMQEAFNETGGGNVAIAILSNENGLTPADEETYRALVDKLRADTEYVLSTQDFVTIPELRQVMTSEDNKAWQLPISAAGTMGTAEGQNAYRQIVDTVKSSTANTSLSAEVIGPAATFEDVVKIGERDQHVIEIATVLIVLMILIIVYRNLVAMLLPLLMIGMALVVAEQSVAGLGAIHLIGLGP